MFAVFGEEERNATAPRGKSLLHSLHGPGSPEEGL